MRACILLVIVFLISCSDSGNMVLIHDVPSSLKEISGMQLIRLGEDDQPYIVAINDSGNTAQLYFYQDPNKVYAVTLQDVENRDWEDLAVMRNSSGNATHILIADIGDNSKSRDDIQIVKVEVPKSGSIPSSLPSTTYNLKYKNGKSRNAEALIFHNDSVFVYSKESEKGYKFYSKVYAARLGDKYFKKQYAIGLKDLENKQKVTGADINSQGKIAISSHNHVMTYPSNQQRGNLVIPEVYNLKHSSQKEAITFINDSTLYLADELKHGMGGNIYQFTLNDSVLGPTIGK